MRECGTAQLALGVIKMELALYIVPSLVFLVWGALFYRAFKKMQTIRERPGFENCWRDSDVIRTVKNNPNSGEHGGLAHLEIIWQ
jgi:hypothetical protein